MQTSQNHPVIRTTRVDRSVAISRTWANHSWQTRDSRARIVALALTNAILEHSLQPGTKLCEQALAEVFGVSRTVARQAVILLETEGLVETERHRGAFVSKPDFDEALEICEALVMIEQAAAAHLVRHLSETEWSELKCRAAEGPQERPGASWPSHDRDFHSLLVGLTGNTVAQSIHARLLRRMELVRSSDHNADAQVLAERNCKMVDLLARGQFRQAASMIDRHRTGSIRSGFVERLREVRPSDVRVCLADWRSRNPFMPADILSGPMGHMAYP